MPLGRNRRCPGSGIDVTSYDTPRTYDPVTRVVMARCPKCGRWLKGQQLRGQFPRLARFFPQHHPTTRKPT